MEPDAPRGGGTDSKGSPEWQEAIFEGSRDAIFISDEDSRFVAVNRAACDLTGYSREELLDLTIPDLHEGVDLEAYNRYHALIMAGQAVLSEAQLLRKDGTKVAAEFNSIRIIIGGTQYEHTTARDVSERHRAEAIFRERDELCQKIFDGANDAIMIVALDGRILEANLTASRRLGYTVDELKHMSIAEIGAPETVANVPQRIARIVGDGHAIFETVQRRRDGTKIPTEVSSRLIDYRGATAILSILRDLSERRWAEQQLATAQKIQIVGRLAAGVAHDFNNILQAMLSQAALLDIHADDPERVKALGLELGQQIGHGASLTRQLLLFSRRETAKPEFLDLNNSVRDATTMLRRLVRANIALEIRLAPGALFVQADRGQMEQVLVNLAVNAADAMPDGGTLMVRTGALDDERVWLTVEDTGTGIPEAIRERIFEPFFTTKGAARGTGLGLSVVHGIVTNHGGQIEVECVEGQGAVFKIILPVARGGESGAAEGIPQAAAQLPTGKGERILVVEDEDAAREALRDVVESLGYEAIAVASGEEAGALPPEQPFDVLLTDLMLPGISGPELAGGLKDRWPSLRVILMSGYTEDEAVRKGVGEGNVRFLQKPFGVAALAAELRAALANGP